MKMLLITANDSKGVTLAEVLSSAYELTLLHTGKIDIECPFNEIELIDGSLEKFRFDDYEVIIYLASRKLPCQYLSAILMSIKDITTNCICISESSLYRPLVLSGEPEKYICKGFKDQMKSSLSFWTIPPVYGDDFLPNELMKSLTDRAKSNRIIIPGPPNQIYEALHVSDLAKAIECFIDDNKFEPELFLSSGQQSTLEELGNVLSSHIRQASVVYSNNPPTNSDAMNNNSSISGWMPEHTFFSELPSIIQTVESESLEIANIDRKLKRSSLFRILSFSVLFIFVCLYTGFIRTSSELQFVDVRLLFIISACLFWGKRYGLAAAILCSIASVGQSLYLGTQWHVIFFHIDNWIPMAIYLASAVLFGMFREKYTTSSV